MNGSRRGGGAPGPKFPLRLDQMSAGPKVLVARTDTPSVVPVPPRPAIASPARPALAVLRPQRLVQQAIADLQRVSSPSGLGLDSAAIRLNMAQRLQATGIRHPAVLLAMGEVPRHLFVDPALVTQAYEDTSLPIGHGQTISKPSVVARMIELLLGGEKARSQQHLGRVLEIGTGCGYQAAVLSRLCKQLVSVERVRALHDKARELMSPVGVRNVRLVFGDGMLGHPPNAPYDAIIAAAGGDELPGAWLDQLAVGGRLVAPVRKEGRDGQVLVVVDRTERGYARTLHEAVQFVPLKSGLVK